MMARSGVLLAGMSMLVLLAADTGAERISDVRNTKHNLSVTGPGPVKAVSESQVCVFCHTPHGAERVPNAPLWNRSLTGTTYTPYVSSSLDIDVDEIAAQPGGSSKICLSCHDGTLAIGAVNVYNGQTGQTIPVTGTGPGGVIPEGEGELTGFTRRLGVDLTNDHPISFTYDSVLAAADGELRDPAISPHVGTRGAGVRPVVPLEDGKLECVSCHDPHIRDTDPSLSIKFLRLNRFQSTAPLGAEFNEATDIVCLACHDKLGTVWADSAHADPLVADEIYKTGSSQLREFPDGVRVWQASCLNCHDTHTVQGAKRLLREGTDALGGPTTPKFGGNPALEGSCYQCHTNSGESILTSVAEVPNIEADFQLPRRMPISNLDQNRVDEPHDVVDADLTEPDVNLGKGAPENRHVECTDCHNPHRVMKNRVFNGTGDTVAGTHEHGPGHTNIASGVLRGSWGVEPVYGSESFFSLPVGYTVKQGDGGTASSTAVGNPYVTREYQICLKCHSDYGYSDNNVYPIGTRPDLGDSGGSTPSGTNGLTQYTNQAREFQAPLGHRGEASAAGGGAVTGGVNHRSWHPVVDSTGRTAGVRSMSASTTMFLAPWDGASIGNQTMYCSDCHGSDTALGTVEPTGGENGNPWGPHGSSNNFILKGPWSSTTGDSPNGLCFRCHNFTNYATEQNEGDRGGFESGFGGSKDSNLHAFHAKRLGRNLRCTWCHVAVPHGWKNKSLLVNLNDVGPEIGFGAGTEVPIGSNGETFTRQPYYLNAKLKVITFARAGAWEETNCGSASGDPDVGREWMKTVCETPP